MVIFHPRQPEEFRERDALLTLCLRPEPLPFAIAAEYPLVLSPEASHLSFCLRAEDRLSSHANLWPRTLVDRNGNQKGRIGLVGNVATDPDLQGRGYMRALLTKLEEVALESGLDALVLWSELDQFYHKLGYASVGQELHISFAKKSPINDELKLRLNPSLDERRLADLLRLRFPVELTLARSLDEFAGQLGIPWLDTFLLENQNGEVLAYGLIGKGYDMVGVVHEWGAQTPDDLLKLLTMMGSELPFDDIMLLAPAALPADWKNTLIKASSHSEQVSMALVKTLNKKREAELASLFIWGLDSI